MSESEITAVPAASSDGTHGDAWYWFWQLAPPLLFFTAVLSNLLFGVPFVILLVFSVPFVAIGSLVSILVRLMRFSKQRPFLMRPALTLTIAVLLMSQASSSFDLAHEQAVEAAEQVNVICREAGRCPRVPDGWTAGSSDRRPTNRAAAISERDHSGEVAKALGSWIPVRADYHPDADEFQIYLQHPMTPMLIWAIRGGAQRPVTATLID